MIRDTKGVKELEYIINHSNSIVFFGGAGVSTESGIPDFRSANGLYNQKYDYPPEIILSHTFFMQETEEFYRFYRDKMIYTGVMPNKAHYVLAEMEKKKRLNAVITQNIDGLHQAAGSNNVLELHGSVHWNYCMKCGKFYPLEHIMNTEGVPHCSCGGIVKPDVVLYEEPLNQHTAEMAEAYCHSAEVLIIGGTSLNVYPAAGYVYQYMGDKLILINRDQTPMDSKAKLVIHDSIAEVFDNITIK